MRTTSLIALLLTTTIVPAHADVPPAATGADAYRHVVTYADMGLHRTGTADDLPTHGWIRDELSALGLQTSIEPFTFPRFEPTHVALTVDALAPEVFPIYYSGRTGTDGVNGPLVAVGAGTPAEFQGEDLDGAIVLIEAPWALNFTAPTLSRALGAAAEGGALGAVVAIQGAENHIVAQNVDARAGLCAFPTVVVGKQDGAALRAREGSPATLVLEAAYHDGVDGREIGTAYNTVGVLEGATDDVILIGTPVNGWFIGGAERGPVSAHS